MNKRVFLSLAPFVLYASIAAAQDGTQAARSDGERLELSQVLDKAGELPSLKSVIVAREGEILAERG